MPADPARRRRAQDCAGTTRTRRGRAGGAAWLLLAGLAAAVTPAVAAGDAPADAGAAGDGSAAAGAGAGGDSFARFVDSTNLEQLARLVVIEDKRGESPDHLTRRIQVLRQEDLDREPLANRNLADDLRHVSGQFVNVLSRNDVNWGSSGGLGPQYGTWLLDGLPVDALADGMVIDPSAIERVEVLKGPAAVLYPDYLTQDFLGTESPLALTANFVLRHHIERDLSWLTAGAGSYDTRRLAAYTQGHAGQALGWMASGDSEHSDYTQAGAPGSFLQAIQPPRYRKDRVFFNVDYAPEGSGAEFTAFWQGTTHAGNLGRPERDFGHHYETLNLGWDQRLGTAWDSRLRVGERRYDRVFGNDAWPASLAQVNTEETRQRILPYDWSVSMRHGNGGLLTAGIDGQAVDYRTVITLPGLVPSTQDQATVHGHGLFVHEKLRVADWTLRAGLRHDSIRQSYALLGGQLPPVQADAWARNLWTVGARDAITPEIGLYANLGTSFAPPTAKQVGGTVSQPGVSGELASPALRPENGIGRDLGVDWQPAGGMTAGLRVFVNSVHDAIVTDVVSQLPSQVIARNGGSAEARGVEVDWRQALGVSTSLSANLTLTRSRVTRFAAAPGDDTVATPFAPDQVANAGLATRLAGVDLTVWLQWVGRYYDGTDPLARREFGRYGTCSLRAGRELAAMDGLRARLSLDIDNLTGRRYDKPFGFRDPGVNAMLALALLTP